MNRRRFLTMLAAIPAALALPPIRAVPQKAVRIVITHPARDVISDVRFANALSSTYANALSSTYLVKAHGGETIIPRYPRTYQPRRLKGMPLDNITMTEGSFITHEADEWYPGLLVRVEEGGDYGFGDTIRFVIELDGEDDQETWALASQKLSPRSKLYGWVKGIDAALIPDVGEPFKYKALENRRVEVMFEAGEEREKVVKIRAEKKAQTELQKRQAATAAAKGVAKGVPRANEGDDSPF